MRRLACVVPGAGIFTMEVSGADGVESLKQAVKMVCPEHFEHVQANWVKLYALKNDDATWFASNEQDTRRLVQGDASAHVRGLIGNGEIDVLATVDDIFVDAPHKGVVHLLATTPGWSSTRTLTCVVPGADIFAIEGKGADRINSLKQAIKSACPEHFDGVQTNLLKLHVLTSGDTTCFASDSEDIRLLMRGDASANVRELIAMRTIESIATVDDVMGDCPSRNVVHLLATTPGWSSTRTLTCVVPGADIFTIEGKGADRINSLKQAIKSACPEHFDGVQAKLVELHVLTSGDTTCFASDSEDIRLLMRGDASASVRKLIATTTIMSIATVDDVFGDCPSRKVVHLLAINPAHPPRPALMGVLGKRARPHWDALNTRLQSLKRGKSNTAALSKVAWDTIQNEYVVQAYTQECRPLTNEIIKSVRREVTKSIEAIHICQSEMERTCILFSLLRELFALCHPRVKTRLQFKLQSQNNVLETAGFADFVVHCKNFQGCVMEAKKFKLIEIGDDDDENESEDKGEDCEIAEPQMMADGFAQALLGMELQNTYKSKPSQSVRGIVSNYTSWTFIRLEYPADRSGLPIVSRDEDRLVFSVKEKPSDEDLIRILGKIMAIVEVDANSTGEVGEETACGHDVE